MVELYSQIVVTRDLPEAGLVAGDVATVVEQYGGEEPSGYELEVFSASGETLDVVSVPADARSLGRSDCVVAELVSGAKIKNLANP